MSNGLPGVAVHLLELLDRAVEPHLGLLLVGDDVGRLLPEPTVLLLGLVIACSSWTFGSACSLNLPVSFAVK